MNNSPGSLEQLSTRIDDLERRVQALEHPSELTAPVAASNPAASDGASMRGNELQAGSLFPVLGRAMLGIAAAYVLRAVATAGMASRLLVTAVAVAYAFAWLVLALRTSQALSRYVYSGTSALILAPMLWEVTLHFNVLTPMMAAAILAGFVTLATALELHEGHARTAWVVQAAAVILAATLAFATHHLQPFLFALLIAVFVTECARCRGASEPAWPLIALVIDIAVWGMIFIYSGPQSMRGNYPEMPVASLVMPGCLLLAIDGTSVAVRVWLQQYRIGIFESIQLVIAFLLAMAGALYFVPAHGEIVAGATCLALAAVLYPTSFIWLQRFADPRNFRVFGTLGAVLLIAGALWTLPHWAAAMLLALAGCAAYFVAARINSMMLEAHGAAFLCIAAGVSEMPRYVFGVWAGSLPGTPAMSAFAISIAATLAFAVNREPKDIAGTRNALQFVAALVAVCGLSALLAHGLLALSALALVPVAHHVAFLRTFTLSLVSLCLAFAGSRWGLTALTRLAYVSLTFIAAKLLFEDLRHGHMAYIAGSIFLFAISLIAVPRLVRLGAKFRTAHQPEMIAAVKN